jgi:antitoxin CptB
VGEKSRLLWRCRRGVKEMDLLLECFLERCYPVLDSDERQAFEAFLEEPDPEILDWIMGRAEPDNPAYRKFIGLLRQINAAPPPADS